MSVNITATTLYTHFSEKSVPSKPVFCNTSLNMSLNIIMMQWVEKCEFPVLDILIKFSQWGYVDSNNCTNKRKLNLGWNYVQLWYRDRVRLLACPSAIQQPRTWWKWWMCQPAPSSKVIKYISYDTSLFISPPILGFYIS